MRGSFAGSISLHALLFGAALFLMASPESFKVEPQESIPVEITSIEDFSKRQAMVKSAEKKKVEKPKAQKQEAVKEVKPQDKVAPEEKKAAKVAKAEPEPPKPEEKKAAEKPPEPVKKAQEPPPPDQTALEDVLRKSEDEAALAAKLAAEELKAAEEKNVADAKKVEDKKKADEKKKADAEKKKKAAEEKKLAEAAAAAEEAAQKAAKRAKEFDVGAIEDILDKSSDEPAAPQKPSDDAGEPIQGEATLQGNDDAIAATLTQKLLQRLGQCWDIPPGAREADITVKVKFKLDQAGNVIGEPQVIGGSGDPLFEVTAQSVVSAVMECQAYDFLPADKYDLWRENTMRFNPNKMKPA